MKLTRLTSLSLLALAACTSTPEQAIPLEAPNVHFKKAVVLAAVAPDKRQEIEDMVAAEIQKRRPYAQVTPAYKQFPELAKLTEQRFQAYLDTHDVEILVTIVPFVEAAYAKFDDWSDVADDKVDGYVGGLSPNALVGRVGVQVVGWNVETGRPVYAKTSQILVGEVVGPRGVADFAVATVTRDI